MGLLQTKIDPTTAKNIMYMCAAAPVIAFGARMVKSAMECVPTSRSARRRLSERADLREPPIAGTSRAPLAARTRGSAATIGDGLCSFRSG
jgi:hypothetical protein